MRKRKGPRHEQLEPLRFRQPPLRHLQHVIDSRHPTGSEAVRTRMAGRGRAAAPSQRFGERVRRDETNRMAS